VKNDNEQFWKEKFHAAANEKAQHALLFGPVFFFMTGGGGGEGFFCFFPLSQSVPMGFPQKVPNVFLWDPHPPCPPKVPKVFVPQDVPNNTLEFAQDEFLKKFRIFLSSRP
jgi:hypothetical protein